jgi:hypothetical protein
MPYGRGRRNGSRKRGYDASYADDMKGKEQLKKVGSSPYSY